MLHDGLSFSRAAKRLGVNRGSVSWATARYGINREPADLYRPPLETDWEARLTERWADRRR